MKKYRWLYKTILFFFVFFQFSFFFLKYPKTVDTANLTSASVTLGNSRISYRAGVASGSLNSPIVTIDSSGNADNNTNHLFPKDTTCFTDAGQNGCIGNTSYTVANIVDSTTFNLTTVLGNNLDTSGYAVASQSGSMTIAFTTASQVPSNGDILITIPKADNANGNNGLPDTTASTSTNGFDLNGIAAADISTTGCTDGNWVATEVITPGSGTTDHTIRIDRQNTACAASSAITVTIDSSPGIVNPAPVTSGHAQGTADTYTINIKTRDGSDNTIDQVDAKVAPVEAVLVSATVDETLSFVVASVGVGTTACNQALDVTTTAYSVPWGTLATADSFSEAAQRLTVSTNADGGYTVKIEENDQMGKDGVTCTGASADESNNCIKDTVCGASACTEAAARDWTVAGTYHGLGISLEDVDGTDAVWDYNGKPAETTCTSGTFCARQIADQEASETKATIMTNTGPVSSKDIYVCYRIAVSGTQPAGYYYNKVKYTATATF
jgi:hypothetical protein